MGKFHEISLSFSETFKTSERKGKNIMKGIWRTIQRDRNCFRIDNGMSSDVAEYL